MGFYLEARDINGLLFATKSFSVWDPNIEHMYVSLGLKNPYGEFSGNKEDATFAVGQLESAIIHLQNSTFYSEPQTEKLHPVVSMMMGGAVHQIDVVVEKERSLKFLNICLDEAIKGGQIVINFG